MRPPRLSSVVWSGFALWGLGVGLVRLHDNSFFTEVATGHLIVSRGVPHADPFSFTAAGHPWVVESWLASVLYAGVDDAGAHGLLLLHAALTVALAALVWRLTRPAVALAGRILAAAAALAVGTGYWSPRPLLIALVLFAVLIAMAESDRAPAWPAVPLMWLWVNVHGSWPVALGYLALRLFGRFADRRRPDGAGPPAGPPPGSRAGPLPRSAAGLVARWQLGRRARLAPSGRLASLLVATAAGVLLGAANPFGLRLLAYPLSVVTRHQAYARIAEWQSPSFSDVTNLVFLAGVLVAFLLLVARRGRFEDGLVLAVFLAAACIASRNVPVASLASVPVLARGLAGMGTLDGARRGISAAAGLAAVAALGAVMVSGALRRPEYRLSAYPVAAVSAMQERGLVPGRVATQDYVGNYLELRYGTRASAFIDDRVDVYPDRVERAYGVLLAGGPGWEQVLDDYRVRAVLWARTLPLAGLVSESRAWRVVWHDRHWLVAVRQSPLRN